MTRHLTDLTYNLKFSSKVVVEQGNSKEKDEYEVDKHEASKTAIFLFFP